VTGTTDTTDTTNSTGARAATVERYSTLARIAVAGGTPIDTCDPGNADCYGAARYDPDQLQDVPDAARRAGLGCGNPHAVAEIAPGDTVLDLGSGGGLDLIVSTRRTGPAGRVYGLDASPEMLALARTNLTEAGVTNATLLDGHIEDIPLPDHSVDVVISNCVVNLSTDKAAVLAEAHRVLRPGGHLGITDIVADRPQPQAQPNGHILTVDEYRDALATAGFAEIDIAVTHHLGPRLGSAIIRASR
jgi:SAM-dependent methyltransferase